MDENKITSERFISLSREYVDDVMEDRKIRIRKEHYYIFAISNFIATKEYFLKKKIDRSGTRIIFDIANDIDILPMIVEFYNIIRSKNKNFQDTPMVKVMEKIEIIPYGEYTDYEYRALYFFHEIRNALSHAGNYEIKEKSGECIVSIKNINSNEIDISMELFDFIAFYINSYNTGTDVEDIFENYLIYKQSKDNKKYYRFESENAINKIAQLLSKTKIYLKKKEHNLTRNISGSNRKEYIDEILDEFRCNYGEESYIIFNKIENANISDEQKLELIIELNLVFRASKRISSVKIDKCIENIKSMLRLDRKSASLYSHSIILFANRKEPDDTNAQRVKNSINQIRRDILSINIENTEKLDNAKKKEVIEKYKQAIENMLEELPNLIRINEHRYRNSIFHNNVKFEIGKIHFWNQKDNTNPSDIHTFDIFKVPQIYNSELKSIECNNINVGEITIAELFDILSQYYEIDEVNETIGKLWMVNQFDNELLKWNMSINDFLCNLTQKIKELSFGRQ